LVACDNAAGFPGAAALASAAAFRADRFVTARQVDELPSAFAFDLVARHAVSSLAKPRPHD
jgi:hypothetical protein